MLNELLTRRLLFVGGKGGVGKTTTAAALALVAAERDRRCLLVSTDPAHSLADLFGRPIGHRETALTASLWALEIDPDRQADEHLETVKARMRRLVHPRSFAEINRQLDLARHAPGTMEAALLERVAEDMALAGAYELAASRLEQLVELLVPAALVMVCRRLQQRQVVPLHPAAPEITQRRPEPGRPLAVTEQTVHPCRHHFR